MKDTNVDSITRLYRACDPTESLPAGDPRYVNCDEVRGEKVIELYERSLRRCDPDRPEIKPFSGHRGVGKTSELLRLKDRLEKPKSAGLKPFKVVFFDVSDKLDLNDLEFADLLVFTAAQVQEQLSALSISGFTPTSQKLTSVWDSIKSVFQSEVKLAGATVDVGFGQLAVELKNRPTAREHLRGAIEQQSTNLLDALNDILTNANVSLRKSGSEGLVLIIDGLDKVVRRMLEDGRTNTHERLFIDRSAQLGAIESHIVFTVPISLVYSPRAAQLEQTFGELNIPVPMIRLHEHKSKKVIANSLGMRTLWKMIEARCKYAEVRTDDVFDDSKTGQYLCKMTGGHPRHLMMFMQASLDGVDQLPITKDAAERAVRNYANSLSREVPSEFWSLLRNFDKPKTDIPKDDDHQQMLLLLHVFEYMNGEPWYEVNPVIRTLPNFAKK